MFGKLKEMFGSKASATKKLRRENIDRRFTIISETSSQGSMSKVYRAVDNENGRSICLKLQDLAKTIAAAGRAHQAGRPTEGEIGQKIVHPHVVRTLEYGMTTKKDYYVVMEYVDGVSLNYVREARGASLAEKIELLAQAAEGLAAVHEAGFIHRDFGPKNLLVNRDDQIKLIDFGLAVPNTPEFQRPGNRTGTLQYMAPELIRREPTDERIDIFSFGVTAFETLTNKLPYDAAAGNSMANILQRINSAPLDPAEVAPDLPPELCEILRKILARRKEDRWKSASTLPKALRGVAAEVGR